MLEPSDTTQEPLTTVEQIKVRVLPDGRMTRRHAARYIGVEDKTLANWDLMKKGPPSILVGGRRFYYKTDLDAFIRDERGSSKPT
jgi:hypothetical protein